MIEQTPTPQPTSSAPPPPNQGFSSSDQGSADKNWQATTGLLLGVASLIAWIVPIAGLLSGITGLILSVLGRKSLKQKMAKTGIILNSIGIGLAIIAWIIVVIAVSQPL